MRVKPWAVVALNMGGPDRPESVEPFLRNLLSDPALVKLPFPLSLFQKSLFARIAARRRLAHARHGYDDMGGGSPLLRHTQAQADGIARELGALGLDARPFVGMRYWHPFADEAAAAIRQLDPAGTIVVSLYPQFSPATGGSSIQDMLRALKKAGLADRPIVVLDRYPVLPGYVAATVASVRAGLAAMGAPGPHVLFSAHGLPKKYVDLGDPYLTEIRQTYDAVLAALGPGIESSLAFQSRVGPREWLRPYVEDHLSDLARRGVRRVLMIPLGFVSDHIETLHEMDETYAGLARSLGMEFHRPPALNDDATFVRALAAACQARVNGSI
jgi:protoporphyrin/coproporphyrin ferrochelatase